MNLKILLIAISAAALTSCGTVYKSGQMPDDVYYSPVRPVEPAVTKFESRDDVRRYDFEERQIRMAAYDRRWRDIDYAYDYNYSYSPYQYGYTYGYYYNPFYYPCPVYIQDVAISNPKNTTPRMTNLNSYVNTKTIVANQKAGATYSATPPYRTFNNSNKTSTRRYNYNTDYNTNSRSNTSDNNTRTYTPATNNTSNSSSSSSSSGGSSSGGVSRPARGQ